MSRASPADQPQEDGRALAWLVAPWRVDDFLTARWQRAPLHLPAAERSGEAAPPPIDLAEVLSTFPGEIRVLADAADPADAPPAEAPASLLAEGRATLYLPRYHESDPWWEGLSAAVARDLGLPDIPEMAVAGLFASPRGRGVAAHFDKNENFILQLEGRKRWSVTANRAVDLPTQNFGEDAGRETWSFADSTAEIRPPDAYDFECVLEPGSVLYVPRGSWHRTEALSERSVSISLTFVGLCWADAVLAPIRRLLIRERGWREQVSYFDPDRFDELLSGLPDTLRELSGADVLLGPERAVAARGERKRYRRNPLATWHRLVSPDDARDGSVRIEICLPFIDAPQLMNVTTDRDGLDLLRRIDRQTGPFDADRVAASASATTEDFIALLEQSGFLRAVPPLE